VAVSTVQDARRELEEWIDRYRDILCDLDDDDPAPVLPVLTDFVLICAWDDAADDRGEGMTYYGRLSSGNAVYRTYGLCIAGAESYTPGG